ncbi:22240_t:CDS:2, partial [Gigaspora margarita]
QFGLLDCKNKCLGQLKYNSVERGMTTLSDKLASIVLPINHSEMHLNSQAKVINPELTFKNFKYAGEALCDIWHNDLIFGENYADTSCCGPPYAIEAMDFLQPNNSFLPPVFKAKDEHFINPIHLLEYYDLLKIPNYDSHCSSLDETTYLYLNCSK